MKIFIATDHAGFELKNILLPFLTDELGHEVIDCGAFNYDETEHYPDFINVAISHLKDEVEEARAIIIGGSGQGEAILANRYSGIRAVVYYGGPEEIISLSREHNDSNVLSLGARFIDEAIAKSAINIWFNTDFSTDERYQRRIDKVENGA